MKFCQRYEYGIFSDSRRTEMLTFEKSSRHPKTFSRLTGVSTGLFSEMVGKIRPLWEVRRDDFREGGRNHRLHGLEDHLLAMMIHYRCHITHIFMGFLFNSHETTVMRSVRRIGRIAVKVIHIEKSRHISHEEVGYLITDVTEQPVGRPKRKQRRYHSGKKKCHTQKIGITTDEKGIIRSVSRIHPGRVHDSGIYEGKKNRHGFPGIPEKNDSGYQGIHKIKKNARIPYKKPKGGQSSPEQRKSDHELSKKRIKVENVIGEIKIFKILSDTYRNRRKGCDIKIAVVAGIVNMKTKKILLKEVA
jgi:DDE superfamily endonuclease/Helix-turn-helix of DDE superfamily endonuclease